MNTQKQYSWEARREIPRSCLPLCDFLQCPGEHWRHVFPAWLNDMKPRGSYVLIKDMDLNARRVSGNSLNSTKTLETLVDWVLVWREKKLSRISEQLNIEVLLYCSFPWTESSSTIRSWEPGKSVRLPLSSLLEQVPAKNWFYGTGTRTTSVSNASGCFYSPVTNKWFSNWPSSPGRQWYSLDLDSGWTVGMDHAGQSCTILLP